MEWFGITCYGVPDPIKDLVRDDYHEPEDAPPSKDIVLNNPTKPLTELVKQLDCYIGPIDGYAYRSHDRLARMRIKGTAKPVGPYEMYRRPATTSMNYGFCDPDLIGKSWYKQRDFRPRPRTDIGKFLDAAKKVDKYFRF